MDMEPLHAMSLVRHHFGNCCLDVGSSDGRNLQMLPEGSVAVDIDISRLSWAAGRYTVIGHDLNKLPLPFHEHSFDTVLMTHVLEHLKEPLSVLSDIKRILTTDGRLIVAVPNSHCIYGNSSEKPYHLHSFSYKSFRTLVRAAGFEIEKAYFNWPKTRSTLFGKLWNASNRLLPFKGLAPDFWLVCRSTEASANQNVNKGISADRLSV
jgi:SAM-dependent methyltransferase